VQSQLKRVLFLTLFFGLMSFGETQTYAAGWLQGTVKGSGGTLHRQPSQMSEVLGKYPSGTRLKVYSETKDGFYAVYFQAEFKGTHYVYISADELEVGGPAVSSSSSDSSQRGSSRSRGGNNLGVAKNRIRLGATMSLFNPSDFQTGIGDVSASFPSIGARADYERQVYKSLYVLAAFNFYSFSQATSSANAGGTYNVTGYGGMLGASYYFINNGGPFSLGVSAFGGLTINSAGNTTATTQITTTSITGVPFGGAVAVAYRFYGKKMSFFGNLGVFLRVGYQLQSFGAVPVYALTSTVQTTSNITLNAPFAKLGLQLEF
jgi:hypothetical protein